MKVRSELIKVIAFLVVGVFFGGLLWVTLGRSTVGVAHTSYSAEFADVSGLSDGDLVKVAGVDVGQVTGVELGDGDRVKVDFDVRDDQPVTASTKVLARYENLIGDRYLELAPGPGDGSRQDPDATIPDTRTVPALDLDVLLNGFKPLFQGLQPDQVNSLATDLIGTLQGQSGTVDSLLRHTASLTSTLADRDEVIGRTVQNLNTVLGAVDTRDSQLSTTLDQLQKVVSGLAADRQTIGESITRVNGFAGDLASLLGQVRPPLQGSIAELGRVATNLDDNTDRLNAVLAQIPRAYESLDRVGSYGTFFNFYLCSVQVKVTGPDGQPISSPVFGSNQNTPRCRLP
ncbi:MCE family protein [Pseudonocardia halophobica]|uniref:Mammalian cell entry protein n=1 Tax=Pseudonocardia halophobica TaxID=29401 RepID=A0A9W6NU12_9PSEU|nr:MlaD family protein [Pseudonocardia halophobica]GLL09850.1 mammalian cell entry protein [Pseudonocardia halophobica]